MSITTTSNLLQLPNKQTLNSQQLNPTSKKLNSTIPLIQICKHINELQQVHAFLIKTSLIKQKHNFGTLLLSFSSFNDHLGLHYARKLFNSIEISKNSFMYNTMIRAYSNSDNPKEAFKVYLKMLCEDLAGPDEFTFTFVFSACSKFNGVFEGKQAHAQMIKNPVKFGTHSWNSLMGFYINIGEVGVVERLFFGIECPDIVSWNCLLDGFIKSGDLEESRRVFDEMSDRDVVSWTTMLVGYVNARLLQEASDLFREIPEKNLVSWCALITGYVQMGCYNIAIDLFKEMQVARVEMDEKTITTLLTACAGLGALDQGRWLHTYVDKHQLKVDAHLSTALIDMYRKCGRIDMARKVFEETVDRKVFVWNSMLGGLAMHYLGEEALELFVKMKECGVEPNEITYINVLAACNHSGLVDVGLQIFNEMARTGKFQPTMEHYGCIVDLLGRAGLIHEAFQVVESMPMKADGTVWRALLSACKIHRNVEVGEQVGRILIEMEPLNDMNYVLLSNVYAVDDRWDDVGKLRREMKVKGLTKTPGCSSIELDGIVHEFVARDHSHPKSREIYDLLHLMAEHMIQNNCEHI